MAEFDLLGARVNGAGPDLPVGSEVYGPLVLIVCKRCGSQVAYTTHADGRAQGGRLHFVLATQEVQPDSQIAEIFTVLTPLPLHLWARRKSIDAHCRAHGARRVDLAVALQLSRDSVASGTSRARKWRI